MPARACSGKRLRAASLSRVTSPSGRLTLFNEFSQEARAACTSGLLVPAGPGYWRVPDPSSTLSSSNGKDAFHSVPIPSEGESSSQIENRKSKIENSGNTNSPWNLYFRVTMEDAINFGLVETMNRAKGTKFSRESFLADCRARARDDGLFQQAYMCNPLGASTNHIVDWSSIEQCRYDYQLERVHLENEQIRQEFGDFNPARQDSRQTQIETFLRRAFDKILTTKSKYRLGFDVAASGQGNLAVIYIDEVKGADLWLRGLFTCRTEDWNFLKTVLFYLLRT